MRICTLHSILNKEYVIVVNIEAKKLSAESEEWLSENKSHFVRIDTKSKKETTLYLKPHLSLIYRYILPLI